MLVLLLPRRRRRRRRCCCRRRCGLHVCHAAVHGLLSLALLLLLPATPTGCPAHQAALACSLPPRSLPPRASHPSHPPPSSAPAVAGSRALCGLASAAASSSRCWRQPRAFTHPSRSPSPAAAARSRDEQCPCPCLAERHWRGRRQPLRRLIATHEAQRQLERV